MLTLFVLDIGKKLPFRDKEFDYVICDNLPEILILRDDAILISQFFWHRVLLNVNKSLCKIQILTFQIKYLNILK